ncbi:MAG: lysophospholipid acyltransferase family protein [Phycisphaerales bacterium]
MRRFEFARRVPGKSALAILWWDVGRSVSQAWLMLWHRLRVVGRERVPDSGPLLFISNHQSFFDPVINGAAVADRQFSPIAREGLFKVPIFGAMIRSWGALSVSGNGGDASAIRVALGELQAGRCVLIYPEGSRSPDGRTQAFERGVLLLQRRAKANVVPMGIDGAFDVWPRSRALPSLRGRIEVHVGELIPAERLAKLSADEAMTLLHSTVEALRLEARASLRARTRGRWPKPGLDDRPAAAVVGSAEPAP